MASTLPIAHLESLKFKTAQIIESIQSLQRLIEFGVGSAGSGMPSWPDILSKYNVILSQSHNLSIALSGPVGLGSIIGGTPAGGVKLNGMIGASGVVASAVSAPAATTTSAYEKIVLHPKVPMPDAQFDNEVAHLLRNQQTTDVLRSETETVRRLSEHMRTRGSLGVLNTSNDNGRGKTEYEYVLKECEEIKREHDARVERAVKAVHMLREKFDWKQRVEVEVEEPEELEWDPRVSGRGKGGEDVLGDGDVGMESEADAEGEGEGDAEGVQSSDEDEVDGALVDALMTNISPNSTQARSLGEGSDPVS